MFVVVTSRLLALDVLGAACVRCAAQVAIESPCQEGGDPADFQPPKWKSRVCVPASISIFNVSASCQVMCSRSGIFMMIAAPYPLHSSSAGTGRFGSHASAACLAAGNIGIPM